jgi:hypothetical protein
MMIEVSDRLSLAGSPGGAASTVQAISPWKIDPSRKFFS